MAQSPITDESDPRGAAAGQPAAGRSLDSEFESAQQTAEEMDRALEERRRRDKDRSFLAKLIGWSFVILVGWVVIAATIGAAYFDWETLTEPAKYLMTILGSVMLPVVTLVIGHYFGKEER